MRRTEPVGEGQGLTDPAEQQQAFHRRSSQAWLTRLFWRSMAKIQRHLGGHDAAGEAQGVGADRIVCGPRLRRSSASARWLVLAARMLSL